MTANPDITEQERIGQAILDSKEIWPHKPASQRADMIMTFVPVVKLFGSNGHVSLEER